MQINVIKLNLFIFCCGITAFCSAQAKLNLDFEYSHYPAYFKYWSYMGDQSYVAAVDTVNFYSGKQSLSIVCRNPKVNPQQHLYFFNLDSLPRALFINKNSITVTAFVKGDSLGEGSYGTIYGNARGGGEFTYEQSNHYTSRSPRGWQRLKLTLPIRKGYTGLLFGCIAHGVGKFWFDKFEVSIDDSRVNDEAAFLPTVSHSEVKWLDKRLREIKRSNDSFILHKSFYKSLQSVKIIGLGESTHGTHEFSIIKNRIISDVVANSEQNVVVAFESPYAAALAINDYVLYGKGNPEKLLNNIANPWRTSEVMDLINGIKNFNAEHETKVSIIGIDMQWPETEIQHLLTYARRYQRDLVPLIGKFQMRSNKVISMNEGGTAADSLQAELRTIAGLLVDPGSKDTTRAFLLVKHSIDVTSQFLSRQMHRGAPFFRDSCMAENVTWISRSFPDHKIIIWAHNAHIAKEPKRMGYFLKTQYGGAYRAVGLLTSFGTFSVFNGGGHRVIPLQKPHVETYEYWFSKARYDNWVVNLNSIDQDARENWVKTTRSTREVGAFQNQIQFNARPILNAFDYLLYIESSRNADFTGFRR